MKDMPRYFGEDGPLAKTIPDFRARSGQVAMAQAIQKAIEEMRPLIAEAGTGTGKTFAYLVPALLSGGKVIISTGTKTLQDQLFSRDLPAVRAALKIPVTVALLKGRANYVCHYHLAQALATGRLRSREEAGHLQEVARFIHASQTGDKAELSAVPEQSGVWPLVTSTRENCLGQECPHHGECFVLAARKNALQADVVVVNHHLFFADIMLRDEGAGELLPQCHTIILDEAHQLPETATLFFGRSLSTTQLIELGRDATAEALQASAELREIPDAAVSLEKSARDLRLSLPLREGRLSRQQVERHEGFLPAVATVIDRLEALKERVAQQAERSEGLHAIQVRTEDLLEGLKEWFAQGAGAGSSQICWAECFSQSLQLNASPLSVAEMFQNQWQSSPRAWILTSATLSVNGDFRHYQQEMGLNGVEALSWDSPFDYARHSLLYVPKGLPEPNTPDYTPAVVESALPVLRASLGRAFLLFTSHRAMKEAYELLRPRLEAEGLDYPVMIQGETTRTELLNRFRDHGHAILLGTQSFWEGVDVKGEALSLVVIDRLPFAPPDDPVMAARIEEINRQGRNAFMEFQLPQAVITLKQGAGRLIRDEQDRGVLMICDPRLIGKPYGRRIWMSLPPMMRTRELADVTDFFSGAPQVGTSAS
jgi:ATP-dependent DNA helicase DinG